MPIELLGDEDERLRGRTRVSGGSLPPGLSVNSERADISGTPTQAGTFDFYLTVTYNRQPSCPFKNPSDDPFRISINPGLPQAHHRARVDDTRYGRAPPYSLQMTATVADPKTWSISSGTLPPGLANRRGDGLDLRARRSLPASSTSRCSPR